MHNDDKIYKIFISAAEPSADQHCGALIKKLKKTGKNFEFTGVGGPCMEKAGCRLIEHTTEKAAMTYKAFAHVIRFFLIIRKVKIHLAIERPDVVVVCDSPAFNFHIAKAAKKLYIKTLFYVAPQLWAWAPWRIIKLRKCCDRLACILPFEEDWFRKRNVDAKFVGNPLVENQKNVGKNRKNYKNFNPESATVVLLPGSRTAEINSLWKPIQQTAKRLRRKFPKINFITVAVDKKRIEMLKSRRVLGFKSSYVTGNVCDICKNADFAIVASGSVTLQVTASGCPMVIIYQSSRILWHLIGRWLIRLKLLSLVNILAQERLVPEFMPYFSSIESVIKASEKLISDPKKLAEMSEKLINLVEPMSKYPASERVSEIIIEMLDRPDFESELN